MNNILNNKIKLEILGFLSENSHYTNKDEIAKYLSYDLELIEEILKELILENRLPEAFLEHNREQNPFVDQNNQEQIWQQCEFLVQKTVEEIGLIQVDSLKYWNPCIQSLLKCSYKLMTTNFANVQSFMYNTQNILGLSIFFQLNHDDMEKIIDNILQYHQHNNDKEQCLFFALLFFFSIHSIDYPHKQLILFLDQIKQLDEAYTVSSRPQNQTFLFFKSLLHFHLAEYDHVLTYYKAYSSLSKITPPILNELFCMHASMAALFSRNYHLSLGIIESYRNTNELSVKNAHALLWCVQLTFLLIHTKNYDVAEKNFLDMLKTIEHIKNIQQHNFRFFSYIYFSSHRGLAYLSYIKNEEEKAYQLLMLYPKGLTETSVEVYPFNDPLVLKMLFSLSAKREIPHYTRNSILQRLDQNMNLFLQGIVFRLLAQEEQDEIKKQEFLKRSFESLAHTSNTKEVLESALLFSEYLKFHNKQEELKCFQQQIKDLHLISQEFEDSTFLQLQNLLPHSYLCINKFSKIIFTSFKQYLQQLLEIIQQELEAQCLAFIKIDSERIVDFYQINISDTEQNDFSFQIILKNLIEDFNVDKKSTVLYKKINQHTSAFYFRSSLQFAWILYLNTSFISAKFSQMAQEEALLFGLMISNEVRMAHYFNTLELQNKISNTEEKEIDSYFGVDVQPLMYKANLVAPTDIPVLIQGESGTGKEEISKYIYKKSQQKGKFIPVQLACISEQLFESALFGSEKGAYTGAFKQQVGFVELAHNGTLFLDEIADIPLNIQIKLLRVLQEKKFFRVGGTQLIYSNFRLVCATNKNLWEEVEAGRFREDLYYRLSSVALFLPPLRERKHDLWEIAQYYLKFYAQKYGKDLSTLQGYLKKRKQDFEQYPWHGNIRELQSVLERYVIFDQFELNNKHQNRQNELCDNHNIQTDSESFKHFSLIQTAQINKKNTSIELEEMTTSSEVENFKDSHERSTEQNKVPLENLLGNNLQQKYSLKEVEKCHIQNTLISTKGKIYGENGALAILGISKSSLYKKIQEYKIIR